jgi:hypothetical protein
MRTTCADEKPDQKWLVFDGPVDTLWIESMNSVMDDNKVLTLINGERIAMPEQVKKGTGERWSGGRSQRERDRGGKGEMRGREGERESECVRESISLVQVDGLSHESRKN